MRSLDGCEDHERLQVGNIGNMFYFLNSIDFEFIFRDSKSKVTKSHMCHGPRVVQVQSASFFVHVCFSTTITNATTVTTTAILNQAIRKPLR